VQEEEKQVQNNLPKTVLKFLLAAGFLGLVLHNMDLSELRAHLAGASFALLLISFVFLNVAQVFSALRMQFYFESVGVKLNLAFSLMLYYVGMFYNLIFPGGIGGDAYKVYLIKKRMELSVKEGIRLLLANRANGLAILVILMLSSLYLIGISHVIPFSAVIITLLIIISTISYFILAKWLLKEPFLVAFGALKYSIWVQAFTVISMMLVAVALGGEEHLPEYVFLFLLAAVMGVLPLSIGGLGIREATFLYGAIYFNDWLGIPLDKEFGVAISLTFFAISALASLIGMIWIDKVTRMEPY
jgi:uncharacterized membrane protein YbhN (UPF0104 family)